MKDLITERLSQYTDFSHEQIEEITRQVFIALGLDQMHEPMTIDRSDYDTQLQAESEQAYHNGMTEGADMIVIRLCHDGIIAPINEEAAFQTIKDLYQD